MHNAGGTADNRLNATVHRITPADRRPCHNAVILARPVVDFVIAKRVRLLARIFLPALLTRMIRTLNIRSRTSLDDVCAAIRLMPPGARFAREFDLLARKTF